jgi:thiol-disulfide isomerase/thioredoxin
MQNRAIVVSALTVIVAVLLVLIGVVALARPSGDALPTTSARAPTNGILAPTSASAAQSAGQVPTIAASTVAPAPMAAPAPKPRPSGPAAPGFDGGGAWVNSAPLELAKLGVQGKVVLVDFWTFGCYNCTNTLPYLKQWWAKYKDQGLVIVGVHTPEFDSERVLENVQDAVKRQEIGWPVVQDNDYAIWKAYGNHYWPHFYLVDERGQIIYDHIGEGAYAETDAQIAAALAERGQQ